MTLRNLKSLLPLLVLCFLFLFLTGINANSEPVQWPVNGHWYDAIEFPTSWIHAFLDARSRSHLGLPGHLATLTSQEENDFVFWAFMTPGYWLGGFQVRWATKPNVGWRWITGELWSFTNWADGQPDDYGRTQDTEDGEENFLQFALDPWLYWNDVFRQYAAPGYMIEYEEMPDQANAPIIPKDIHLGSKLTTTWAILKQAH